VGYSNFKFETIQQELALDEIHDEQNEQNGKQNVDTIKIHKIPNLIEPASFQLIGYAKFLTAPECYDLVFAVTNETTAHSIGRQLPSTNELFNRRRINFEVGLYFFFREQTFTH